MPIQVARVIGEVRRVTQDTNPDAPRNSNQDIRAAANMAVQDIRRVRPDLFLGMFDAVPDLITASSLDIEDMFLSPLVHLTVAYVMMASNEYNVDGAAANFLSLGRAQLGGA